MGCQNRHPAKTHSKDPPAWVDSVAYSPDGNTIATASGDHTVRLWDTTTGTLINTLKGHINHVL